MRNASPEATRAALRELSDRIACRAGVRAVSFLRGAIPLAGEDDLFSGSMVSPNRPVRAK